MFDNAQSGDEKVTQILGECAMVYATKIHGPKIVCVYLPAQIIYVLLFIIFDVLIFIYYSQMWCTSTWDLLHSVKMMGIAKCTEGLKALPWSVYLDRVLARVIIRSRSVLLITLSGNFMASEKLHGKCSMCAHCLLSRRH